MIVHRLRMAISSNPLTRVRYSFRLCRTVVAKLRNRPLQSKYSAPTMPTTNTTNANDTQKPSRFSMMWRASSP